MWGMALLVHALHIWGSLRGELCTGVSVMDVCVMELKHFILYYSFCFVGLKKVEKNKIDIIKRMFYLGLYGLVSFLHVYLCE